MISFRYSETILQYGLPTTATSLKALVFVATPKSASFTRPSFVVRILAPLMSL